MSVTDGLRGAGLYTPSWTQSCNGNPSINELLDQIDIGAIENANDTVKDFHIDWGLGPDQVNTDDMPEGSTNLYYHDSLVQDLLDIVFGFGAAGDFLVTNPTTDGYLWQTTLPGDRITLDTSNFNKNLGPSDSDVQTALETIDELDVGGVSFQVNQVAHGYSNLSAVYHNGTNWQLAKADSESTLATHVITNVIDVDNFVVSQVGKIIVNSHGLTSGMYYFTSEVTAGLLTTTEGVLFSNPMLYVLNSNELILLAFRANMVTGLSPEIHDGGLIDGYFVRSIVSNNLLVEIKHKTGVDPSPTTPVYVLIDGVLRSITTQIGGTINAGSNNLDLGDPELAGIYNEIALQIGWDSANSICRAILTRVLTVRKYSDIDTGIGRIGSLKLNGTPGTNDSFVQVGTMSVQLSNSGGGYVWSIPTLNETSQGRVMSTRPILMNMTTSTVGGASAIVGTPYVYYQVDINNRVFLFIELQVTSNATSFNLQGPFLYATNRRARGLFRGSDNGSGIANACLIEMTAASKQTNFYKDMAGTPWTASGNKSVQGGILEYFIL